MTKEALADGATFLVADVRKDSWPKIEEYPGTTFATETTAWLCLSLKNFKSD